METIPNGQWSLLRHGKEVNAIPVARMIGAFLDFLPPQPILFAHDWNAFASRVLLLALKRINPLEQAAEKILGFVDSLPLPKELLPSQASYALESLYQNTGGKSIDGAHAARANVPALWDVLMKLSCSSDQMDKHRITLNSALEKDKKSLRDWIARKFCAPSCVTQM